MTFCLKHNLSYDIRTLIVSNKNVLNVFECNPSNIIFCGQTIELTCFMAAILPDYRIEIPVGEFGRTWRDDIFEMNFLIQSPEKTYLNGFYQSKRMPLGRDGIDVFIGMQRCGGYLHLALMFEMVS